MEKFNEKEKGADVLETEDIDKEKAREIIMSLWQEIYAMGANDSEHDSIKKILDKLDKGDIEPAEAVETVRKIRYSKQDYH
jgi:hypothetical protein